MLGIYYVIRHKETGELMPELKRTRGYSHWNPSKVNTVKHLKGKIIGVPRLFSSRRRAFRAIVHWNACPNGRYTGHTTYDGEEDYFVDYKPDGRKKEDLEIVEVDISEVIK